MLHKELPKYLAPEKLCRNAPVLGDDLVGTIKFCNLANLSKELKSQDREATVSLNFSMDLEGLCCIKGDISADLEVICQRCLQPMSYTLKAEFMVSPVKSDKQAEQLPERYEPLLMSDGEINVSEWIAEEIHLALPLAPCHEPPCVSFSNDEGEEDQAPPQNPFMKLI